MQKLSSSFSAILWHAVTLGIMSILQVSSHDSSTLLQRRDSIPQRAWPPAMRLEEEQLESRRRRLLDMTEAARGGQHVGAELHQVLLNSGGDGIGRRSKGHVPSAGSEGATELRGVTLPHTCGGVTFSKDESNFLVRSDNGANSEDCGPSLSFQENGIAGLGYGVFANMSKLTEVL